MLKKLVTMTIILVSMSSIVAQANQVNFSDVTLDEEGTFLSCTLIDGRELTATSSLVSVGNLILSKNPTRAYTSKQAENIEYSGWEYKVRVAKQFSARGGMQAVHIEHIKSPKTSKDFYCQEKNEN